MKDLKITDVRIHPGDSSFLIDDGETAVLYDTGFGFTGGALAEKLKGILGERSLDFLFLSHSHYDHVLGSVAVAEMFPGAEIVAGEYTAEIFRREGALRKMRELDEKFAAKCGIADYRFTGDRLRVDRTVKEGDVFTAGKMRFCVVELPGHTRCSIGYYLEETGLLLAAETLGVYDGTDTIVPSFLVSVKQTLESIDKVLQMDVKRLVIPHYGLLTEEETDFFLKNMRDSAAQAADFLAERIRRGMTTEEIVEDFKNTYRKQYMSAVYPEDAVNLNTSIMVEVVRREYGL